MKTVTSPVYDANGHITQKSDVGSVFQYTHPTKPYALTGIETTTALIPQVLQEVSYTSFEQPSVITESPYQAAFLYNSDEQRARMEVKQNGSTILTRWYAGSRYMKETAGSTTREYTWIGGDAYTAPCVAVKTNTGSQVYYYLLRDHLGNITHQVNMSNTVVAEYSFDSCSVKLVLCDPRVGGETKSLVELIPISAAVREGRRRNKEYWTYSLTGEPELLAGRGFTEACSVSPCFGERSEAKAVGRTNPAEQSDSGKWLPWFNLYNMNGRLYDPAVGRFLSPDNYVQMPDNTQNFNRYSYALNNPLKYTDPDGEFIFTLLAAIIPGAQPLLPLAIAADIGGIINTANNWEHVSNAYDNNFFSGVGKMFGFFGVGAGKAAATYYAGPLGTIASSYGGDALNSLLVDGTFDNFHPDVTTQNLFVDIAVGQLGVGNSLGKAGSKIFKNELAKNISKQIISQNVDGLISSVGVRTWQTGSIKDGFKNGWQDYTKGGGWWKYSLSGVGQGIMDTYDSQTITRNRNREAMQEYYKENKSFSGFSYPNHPGTWMESLYQSQMKASTTLNLRLYSPTRNFFSTTLPRWYYPELYNY